MKWELVNRSLSFRKPQEVFNQRCSYVHSLSAQSDTLTAVRPLHSCPPIQHDEVWNIISEIKNVQGKSFTQMFLGTLSSSREIRIHDTFPNKMSQVKISPIFWVLTRMLIDINLVTNPCGVCGGGTLYILKNSTFQSLLVKHFSPLTFVLCTPSHGIPSNFMYMVYIFSNIEFPALGVVLTLLLS